MPEKSERQKIIDTYLLQSLEVLQKVHAETKNRFRAHVNDQHSGLIVRSCGTCASYQNTQSLEAEAIRQKQAQQ